MTPEQLAVEGIITAAEMALATLRAVAEGTATVDDAKYSADKVEAAIAYVAKLSLAPPAPERRNAHLAKVSFETAEQIRFLYRDTPATTRAIAKRFGLSKSQVAKIARWESWQ